MTLFECTIPEKVMTKKNHQRTISRLMRGKDGLLRRRKFRVPSEAFESWEAKAMPYVKQAMVHFKNLPIREYCRMEIVFYFKNHSGEPDVSNALEGPQDLLEKCGVIVNDKLIQEIHARKVFGHEPKTVLRLMPTLPNLKGVAV